MATVEISFENSTAATASQLADDLARRITSMTSDVSASVVPGPPDAMDFGATVAVVLGTPAVVILARGIADWIRKQGDPDLVIKTSKRSVTVKGGLDLAAKREIILAALGEETG